MKPSPYKALITDIDGTLVQYRPDLSGLAESDLYVSKNTVMAIAKLHDLGHKVAAVTGRTYEQSKDVLTALGITGPCVFAGGATIRSLPDGEILFEASLKPEALDLSMNVLRQILGSDYPIELAPAAKNTGQFNSIWTIIGKDLVAEIADKLSHISEIYYVVNGGSGNDTQCGLAILSEEADKGKGARRLLSLLGVRKEEAVSIGDGANDEAMFDECGFNIAMGNGERILKQKADYIVANIDEDGFSEAVEHILSDESFFHDSPATLNP